MLLPKGHREGRHWREATRRRATGRQPGLHHRRAVEGQWYWSRRARAVICSTSTAWSIAASSAMRSFGGGAAGLDVEAVAIARDRRRHRSRRTMAASARAGAPIMRSVPRPNASGSNASRGCSARRSRPTWPGAASICRSWWSAPRARRAALPSGTRASPGRHEFPGDRRPGDRPRADFRRPSHLSARAPQKLGSRAREGRRLRRPHAVVYDPWRRDAAVARRRIDAATGEIKPAGGHRRDRRPRIVLCEGIEKGLSIAQEYRRSASPRC